uniref:Uncharacterized protein n=1 Tax=Zea mays TaxID=4577 RepID=A0A804RCK3_MAIZE
MFRFTSRFTCADVGSTARRVNAPVRVSSLISVSTLCSWRPSSASLKMESARVMQDPTTTTSPVPASSHTFHRISEHLVPDLGDLGADLAEDLRAPALDVGEVAALEGEVGPALSGLARGFAGRARCVCREKARGTRRGGGRGSLHLDFAAAAGVQGGVAVAEVGGMRGEQAGVRGWPLRQRRSCGGRAEVSLARGVR